MSERLNFAYDRFTPLSRTVFFLITYNLAEADCWSCTEHQRPVFSLLSFSTFFLCEAKAKGVFPEDIHSCRVNLESLVCTLQKDRQGLDVRHKRCLQKREHRLCCDLTNCYQQLYNCNFESGA